MESSQSLAIESFSNSWLTSVNSSLEGLELPLRPSLDISHEATLKEYKMLRSRKSLEEAQNFKFDVPISQSPDALAHADQLFSDGLIKPISFNQSKIEASKNLAPVPAMCPSKAIVSTAHIHCHSFGRWKRLSERILQKCFAYLRPPCLRGTSSRKSIRVNDIDRRAWEVNSWTSTPSQASPIQITAHSTNDWCDIERSIYEAILHCKRSVDK